MDSWSGDFKGFGDGFEGFPKRSPDDTVEYRIYVVSPASTTSTANQVRSRLNDVLLASREMTKSLLKDYIWQRDAFALNLVREDDFWLLKGSTSFGDSINDEWLVVYILRELSKKFPDTWSRVYDTDGEFLLIEAADFIPGWAEPDIVENRIWINNAQVRLISPMASSSTGEARPLSVKEAIDFIASEDCRACHLAAVDREAFRRTRDYPKAIESNLHRSLATIPRQLAWILHRNPAYVSPAVEAFYLRYPLSTKTLSDSSGSKLRFPPQDFVNVSVRFNRAGFAQTKAQNYDAPQSWAGKVPKSLAAVDGAKIELGMKLSCGFEMLLSDPKLKDKPAVREIEMLLDDLESGDETLPTDDEIKAWPQQDDDESWRNISMENFDDMLSGKRRSTPAQGFGDRETQENLRRMVERFKKIMKDGGDDSHALLDDDDDDSSEDEDEDVQFDPFQYAQIMRHAVVLPQNLSADEFAALTSPTKSNPLEDNEFDDIRKLTERMEAELNAAGAFKLDEATKAKLRAKDGIMAIPEDEEESEDEALEIDFNAARDLLAKLQVPESSGRT